MDYEVDKWDVEISDFDDVPLNKKNPKDVKGVKEYCEEQSLKYNHKNCKPLWCDDCQLLTGYLVNY